MIVARINGRSPRHVLVAIVTVIAFAALGLGPAPGTGVRSPIHVHAQTQAEIQHALDRLPPTGGTVLIIQVGPPIAVSQSIVIDRDNVTLEGLGSVELELAAAANQPVLVLGQTLAVPTVARTNIHVRNLVINGNRRRQTLECNPAAPALRNNGISLRRVEDCSVERVTAFACRSGGLVTELGCHRVVVSDLEAYDNQFDGLACYETRDSEFRALRLHDNLAAGVSLDIDFEHNVIRDSFLAGNHSVGIFMRDSRDNDLVNLHIKGSGDHGIFLAQVEHDPSTAASRNEFRDCVISGSGGAGFRLNDPTCVDNTLRGVQMLGNGGGTLSQASPGLVTLLASDVPPGVTGTGDRATPPPAGARPASGAALATEPPRCPGPATPN